MDFDPYFTTGYSPYPVYQRGIQPSSIREAQNFSRPTIHAKIVLIDGDREEAENFPVQVGGTQMMINKAETKIFIKSVYANGQYNVDEYVKQTPMPKKPDINYENFVTRDELEQRLAAFGTKEGNKNEEHISKTWKSDKSNPTGNANNDSHK